MALGADPWSDNRRGDDESHNVEGATEQGDSSELPHWTDPPTGDIPRVLLELSSDPPLWRSPRRGRPEDDIWHSVDGIKQGGGIKQVDGIERVEGIEQKEWDGAGLGSAGSRRSTTPSAKAKLPSNGQPARSTSGRADYHDRMPIDQGQGSTMDSRYAKESEPRRGRPEPHKGQATSNSDAIDDPTRSQRAGGRHSKKTEKRLSRSVPSRAFSIAKRSARRGEASSVFQRGAVDSASQRYPSTDDATPPRSKRVVQSRGKNSGESKLPRGQDSQEAKPRSAVKATVTGLLLGAVVIAAAALGARVMLVLVLLAVVLALIEYLELARVGGAKPIGIVALVGAITALLGAYARGFEGLVLASVLVVVFSMIWFLAGLGKGSPSAGISSTFMGFLWVGGLGSFAGLILEPKGAFGSQGPGLMLAALICTSASDVFAYAGGSIFGKHRLAPSLSPSKTQEGLAIGAVATVLAGTLIVGQIHPFTMSKGLVLGLVVAIVAPIGDLAESMVKRDLGVKDSGSLLPGHGGILDRIDGVLFALPFVYYLFRLLHL